MSEENKNIDQLFSDVAHSEAAPQYDSAYWAEMNDILNARDAKKRAFVFWSLGGSAVFALLFLSLFTINIDDSSVKERYVRQEIDIHDDVQIEKETQTNDYILDGTPLNTNPAIRANKKLTYKTKTGLQTDINEFIGQKSNPNSTGANLIFTQKDNKASKHQNKNGLARFGKNSTNTRNQNTLLIDEEKSKIVSSERNENKSKENVNDWSTTLPFTSLNHLAQKNIDDITLTNLELKSDPRYTFYVRFNGGLMENYKTSRPYESGLLDLSLNLEINMNHVLLRTGLGTQLTSNADLIVSQRKTINGVTVVKQQTDLSYQNLVDLFIPLEFGYQLNKTSFGVGAQVNYLITTSMDLNNYENNILVNTKQHNGNKDGLNNFSTQGYLWIEQRLSPVISLGLKTGTNISGRIKDGAYFNESATTNPIYGQLSLRINLNK